jgi:hypothetical protein
MRQNKKERVWMKRWFVCRFAFSVLLVSFLATVTHAQVPTGTINGRVTDSGNAVVTGAQVVVVNQSMNVPRETVTNSDGLYLFSDLSAGQYDITIKASGFATSEFRDVVVQAGRAVTVDAKLKVASVGPTVCTSSASASSSLNISEAAHPLRGTFPALGAIARAP